MHRKRCAVPTRSVAPVPQRVAGATRELQRPQKLPQPYPVAASSAEVTLRRDARSSGRHVRYRTEPPQPIRPAPADCAAGQEQRKGQAVHQETARASSGGGSTPWQAVVCTHRRSSPTKRAAARRAPPLKAPQTAIQAPSNGGRIPYDGQRRRTIRRTGVRRDPGRYARLQGTPATDGVRPRPDPHRHPRVSSGVANPGPGQRPGRLYPARRQAGPPQGPGPRRHRLTESAFVRLNAAVPARLIRPDCVLTWRPS